MATGFTSQVVPTEKPYQIVESTPQVTTQGGLYTTPLMGNKTVAGSGSASYKTGSGGLMTATNQTAGYQTVDPIYRTVDKSTETVQGQLNDIIDWDSPLMTRARSRAVDQMGSRGLSNSTMAVGAGEAALYDTALQIATPDAATYAQASRDNQAVGNQAAQFNAGAFNAAEQFNTGQATDTARFNADFGNKLNLTNIAEAGMNERLGREITSREKIAADQNATQRWTAQLGADTQRYTANLGAETQRSIAALEANNRIALQESANANQMFQQTNQNILAIQQDPNLTSGAKATLINQQLSYAQTGMQIAGRVSGTNYGDIINWGGMMHDENQGRAAPAPAPAPSTLPRFTLPGGSYGGDPGGA